MSKAAAIAFLLGIAAASQIEVAGQHFTQPGTRVKSGQLLSRIANRESRHRDSAVGDCGLSRGRYQISEAAWCDVNARRKDRRLRLYDWRTFSHHEYIARVYAAEYLEILREHFRAAHAHCPTDDLLMRAWRTGPSGIARTRLHSQQAKRK